MSVIPFRKRSTDTEPLSHACLKARQRAIRDGFPPDFGLRVHRALSWLGRAEREADDPDAQFLFLWIAFNAAYADDLDLPGERARRRIFFGRLDRHDPARRIYNAIWTHFSGPIRLLMESKYTHQRFWDYHNGDFAAVDWPDALVCDAKRFRFAIQTGRTAATLTHVFDRLYVLRNQLVHGGATWNSRQNRSQIRDGAAILGFLVPAFLDLMMDHPHEEWGTPLYPVIDAD